MEFRKLAVLIGITSVTSAGIAAPMPSMEEMWEIIQQQQQQITSLQQQLGQQNQQLEETQVQIAATADALDTVSSGTAQLASWAERTQIGGYAEHHYNHQEDGDDQVDAHRWVLFFGHQFSDNLRMFSEFELEHSLAGEGEPGEVELEQAYIEYDFADNHSVQIGQFLVPVGILNETHEPDTFFGVERNKVEAEIIPSTWWETGVMVRGEITEGLSYNAAVHSGLSVQAKFDEDTGMMLDDSFRIRSGRQKSAEANAEDLAFTGRIKYTGIPGLELATTYQHQQDITQGDSAFSEGASADLWEAHAIYQTERFGLRALYADWDIDSDEAEMLNVDNLDGWYVEPSFKLNEKLGVFVRYSEYERADKIDTEFEAWDYGVNYWIHPRVVLKADYTDTVGDGDEADALNLGVGWSF